MINFEEFLNFIKSQNYYNGKISHIHQIPAKAAEFGKLKSHLKKRLIKWLRDNSIELWAHQVEAIDNIIDGNNTVIVTSTASGKSLCYNLPVLQSILEDSKSTALYVFPTKALARDQYALLLKLMTETNIKTNRVGIYDGDIEPNEKRQVLDNANVVITNPYGLHFYLPWFKRKWNRVCYNLKYIVLDEIHVYRGIFGSNFALNYSIPYSTFF
jgi:DEAD/DEAH box helicase domain-containing protein